MRTLLHFLARHSNIFLFIILEVAAVLLATSSNRYAHSTFWSEANQIVATVNNCIANVVDYLHLKSLNDDLAKENASLQRLLQTTANALEPSIENDSIYLYPHLGWQYIPAKVISASFTKQHNYIAINKGHNDGIQQGMGVICSNGIVGVVSATNPHYSLVTPAIHVNASINCRLLHNGYIVDTKWLGQDANTVQLTDVSRHIPIHIGDTVITSGLTQSFPEGIMVGLIKQDELKPTDSYHTTTVHLTTDFRQLRYVQVIHNPFLTPIINQIDSVTHDTD